VLGLELKHPDLVVNEEGHAVDGLATVKIILRTYAGVMCACGNRGKFRPSPEWMQERLISCGFVPLTM